MPTPTESAASGNDRTANGEPEKDALYTTIEAAAVVGYSNWLASGKSIGVAHYITETVYGALTDYGVIDALRDRIEKAIHARCATFEVTFDAGPGDVVGVPDAALIAAKEVLSGG